MRKFFRKTKVYCPLKRTRTCGYQEVRNISFSEYFANVLNELSLNNINEKAIKEKDLKCGRELL